MTNLRVFVHGTNERASDMCRLRARASTHPRASVRVFHFSLYSPLERYPKADGTPSRGRWWPAARFFPFFRVFFLFLCFFFFFFFLLFFFVPAAHLSPHLPSLAASLSHLHPRSVVCRPLRVNGRNVGRSPFSLSIRLSAKTRVTYVPGHQQRF